VKRYAQEISLRYGRDDNLIMANLTVTARITRQSIVVGVILVFLIAIGTALWSIAPISQPIPVVVPTPMPESRFGLLPPLELPASTEFPTSFKLETISGGPPVSTSSAFVYFVPQKTPHLFSRRNAEALAESLTFTDKPKDINETTLAYTNDDKDTLVIDITSKNFTLKRTLKTKSKTDTDNDSESINLSLPPESTLKQIAQSFFTGLVDWDQNLTLSHVSYFKQVEDKLNQELTAANATHARVDFLQQSIGRLPVITTQQNKSDIYVVFNTFGNTIDEVLEASYQSFPYDLINPSSYPTISGNTAWELLQTGKGYIISSKTNTATVREGHMAYFQELGYHPYLQPVYVFEGDNDFIGVVPAIDPMWIGK
jgi:hypothetical protein